MKCKLSNVTRNLLILSRADSGAAGVGALLLFATVAVVFILVSECFYVYNIKQNIDIELARAANTAVDMSMSDAHRQDRISELDEEAAYVRFFNYLYDDMNLTSRLEARSPGGSNIYILEIDNLTVTRSPPGISITGTIAVQPLFISGIIHAPIRVPVRCNSINRRFE